MGRAHWFLAAFSVPKESVLLLQHSVMHTHNFPFYIRKAKSMPKMMDGIVSGIVIQLDGI